MRIFIALSCFFVNSLQLGYNNLKNPYLSKGMSNHYPLLQQGNEGLRGLVPKGDVSHNCQQKRLMGIIDSLPTNIEKYTFLQGLQDTSEHLYFSLLIKYTEKLMPLVYTPTVGEACLKWSELFRETPRGLYISLDDLGRLDKCFDNWPNKNVKVIVITDGERILGLGDLGSNGMGIPIGKLALYTACAGIPPEMCLPIQIDVGCNNKAVTNDPYYIGLKQQRASPNDPYYDALIYNIITTAQKKYGREVLIQFEDFGNFNAFRLLKKWKNTATCFNDDIQGTASVILGGLLATQKMKSAKKLKEHTFLFFGAGEAGVGIANLISDYINKHTSFSWKGNIFLFDSQGLVESSRSNLSNYKKEYAHDVSASTDLEETIRNLKPTVLIGVSGQGQAFNKRVISTFTEFAGDTPIIMALSNPTSKAECTAEQAYEWSNNKAIFISGSPFNSVLCTDGNIRKPGQGNNAYVFPGIGLGAVTSGAFTIDTDDMIIASETIANMVSHELLEMGSCYPALSDIRNVSLNIATEICKSKWKKNKIFKSELNEGFLKEWIYDFMYK